MTTTENSQVYQLLAHGRWFSPSTPASFTTKTGRHDIAESGIKHQKLINQSMYNVKVLVLGITKLAKQYKQYCLRYRYSCPPLIKSPFLHQECGHV